MNSKQKGYTLIELLTVICIIMHVFLVLVVGTTVIKGNFWYTDESVLKALKSENPKVEQVLKSTRNVWDYSEIIVQEEGLKETYFLDTDIFWNYEFHRSQDD